MDELHKEFATMKFKKWIIEELNKGLVRQFKQQQPNLPNYVAKQVLQNRVAPLFNKTVNSMSPTISMNTTNAQIAMSPGAYSKPSDMFQDKTVTTIGNNKNWKLQVIEVHPLHFDQETIQSFLSHQFGSSPILSKVKNHDIRMQTQSDLASQRGQGENEPIIVVRNGDKYKMEEGWHRLYSYLMNYSAPPEEKQKIDSGNSHTVDLTVWKPVKIKAYVGG